MTSEGTTATIEAPSASQQADAAREARADAAADAVLAATTGGKVEESRMSEVRAKAEKAAANPTIKKSDDSAKAEAKDGPAGGEKKPGPVPGEKAARETREKDAIARHALKRAKFTDEEIDGMNPSDRILTGLKLKTQQDEAQQRHDSGAAATQHGDKRTEPREGEGQGRPTDPRTRGADPTLDPRSDGPAREELERVLDELDDDAKDILENAMKLEYGAAEKAVKEARKTAEKAKSEMFDMRRRMVRGELKSEFPKIGDDSRFAEVEEFMERLEDKSAWSGLSEDGYKDLVSTAAAAVFGREAIQAARADRTEQLSQDIGGQPHAGGGTSGRGSAEVKRMTARERREDAAAEAVIKYPGDEAKQKAEMSRLLGE